MPTIKDIKDKWSPKHPAVDSASKKTQLLLKWQFQEAEHCKVFYMKLYWDIFSNLKILCNTILLWLCLRLTSTESLQALTY